ncbi:hypothetical protein MJ1HA_0888 [Metallosphaera sedula]|nr:hypothetical protein MJ1HA_0888 [Metallosphaera sedula]
MVIISMLFITHVVYNQNERQDMIDHNDGGLLHVV